MTKGLFNLYHYVYYSRISRVSHYFLTNAPIMSHEISLISCVYHIKSQNIVWIKKRDIQGVFCDCRPPKSSKCQPVRKFWNLELFWWDFLYNLTLRTFRGATVTKKKLYIESSTSTSISFWFWPCKSLFSTRKYTCQAKPILYVWSRTTLPRHSFWLLGLVWEDQRTQLHLPLWALTLL